MNLALGTFYNISCDYIIQPLVNLLNLIGREKIAQGKKVEFHFTTKDVELKLLEVYSSTL